MQQRLVQYLIHLVIHVLFVAHEEEANQKAVEISKLKSSGKEVVATPGEPRKSKLKQRQKMTDWFPPKGSLAKKNVEKKVIVLFRCDRILCSPALYLLCYALFQRTKQKKAELKDLRTKAAVVMQESGSASVVSETMLIKFNRNVMSLTSLLRITAASLPSEPPRDLTQITC